MIKKGDVRLLSKNPKAECIGKVSNQLLVFLKGQTADAYDSVLATYLNEKRKLWRTKQTISEFGYYD